MDRSFRPIIKKLTPLQILLSCITPVVFVRGFIFLFLTPIFFLSPLFAQEKPSLSDLFISAAIKTMARTFVALEDIDKLKQDNIADLSRMEDLRFQKRYAKAYAVLKDLPENTRSKYNIRYDITKEEAIKQLENLDKKKIYKVIDELPDYLVAREFRLYVSRHTREFQEHNILEQINIFWSRVTLRKQNHSLPQKVSPPS